MSSPEGLPFTAGQPHFNPKDTRDLPHELATGRAELKFG